MHAHAFPFTWLVGTGVADAYVLTQSVLYLQGSDSGQKYFKI